MTIRVLHLLTALGHGGAEVWLLNLIEPLRRRGVDVGFVLKAPELGKLRHVAEQRGASVYENRLDPTFVRYVRGIVRIAKHDRYDIVHTHEFVHSAPGVVAARIAGLPSAVTFHHYTFEAQTPLTRKPVIRQVRTAYGGASVRFSVRAATRVTALSDGVMSRIVPKYRDEPRCRLLRLSVESRSRADADERGAVRGLLGLPTDAPIVLHAGRLIEQKNHAGLLRVFRRVHDRRPDARLVFMGQGPMKDAILHDASDLLASGAARFFDVRDDLQRLMAASDVLLFPSLNEGFGLVALEANACGLPVVGSRVPGLVEALEDGVTALLHDVADEDGMAASVLRLLGDEPTAAAMGATGRRRAMDLYSHDASADLLATMYREMVTCRR